MGPTPHLRSQRKFGLITWMPSTLSADCSIRPLTCRAWAVLRRRPSMSWWMKTWPVYMYWTRLDMSSYWMLGSSTTCSELGVACKYWSYSVGFVFHQWRVIVIWEDSSHDLTFWNFCLFHFLCLLFYLRFVKIKVIEAKYEKQWRRL